MEQDLGLGFGTYCQPFVFCFCQEWQLLPGCQGAKQHKWLIEHKGDCLAIQSSGNQNDWFGYFFISILKPSTGASRIMLTQTILPKSLTPIIMKRTQAAGADRTIWTYAVC